MKPIKIIRLLSILLLLLSIVLSFIDTGSENNLPEGFFTPIIAFEFIQNYQQIVTFFKVKDITSFTTKMLLANQLDYIFMLVYSFLLFIVSWVFFHQTKKTQYIIAMLLCVIMLLTDGLENLHIRYIINNFWDEAITNSNLFYMKLYTWTKWMSIAIVFLLFAFYFFVKNKVVSFFQITPIVLGVSAYFYYGILNELFALSVVVNFFLLVIIVWFKPKLLS